jgi:hypothetical protein
VWLATLCLALGTYLSLYPALLLFPLVAIAHTYYKQRGKPKALTLTRTRALLYCTQWH